MTYLKTSQGRIHFEENKRSFVFMDVNFPTRTMEALIEQNKTLSAKLNSFSYLCNTQGKQIRELKKQYEDIYKEDQKKAEKNKMLMESYQKLQVSYQDLQNSYQTLKASHQNFKDNLIDTEKQFAVEYTDFLEKEQILKSENSKLKSQISRFKRYKDYIHKQIKPYLKKLKWEKAQHERQQAQQKEKISSFQKQLKDAYSHIQQLSSSSRHKEDTFQKKIDQLTQQLSYRETEIQQNKKYISENQQLNKQLLENKNNVSELKATLTLTKQDQVNLKKQHAVQVEKFQKQVQTLTAEKEDLFHQLKVFSKELTKKENTQSQINTLLQKKLTQQVEKLQHALNVQNSPQQTSQGKVVNTSAKELPIKYERNKCHHIYQTLLEVQTGFFKILP